MLDIWIEWPVSADQTPNFVPQFGDELTLICLVRVFQVVLETENSGSIAVINHCRIAGVRSTHLTNLMNL